MKVLDISEYNIDKKLGGVGLSILLHVVHGMDDGHDIRVFLSSLGCAQEVMKDDLFPWSIAPVLSKSYPLRTVPVELTEIVCSLLSLTKEFKYLFLVYFFLFRMSLCIIIWRNLHWRIG